MKRNRKKSEISSVSVQRPGGRVENTEEENNMHQFSSEPQFIIKPVDECGEIVGIVEISGYERDSRESHREDFIDCMSGDLTFCVVAKTNKYFAYDRFSSVYSIKNSNSIKKCRKVIYDYFQPDSTVGYIVGKRRFATADKPCQQHSEDKQEYLSIISFVVHPKFRRLGIAGDMFECLFSITPHSLPINVSVPIDCIEACRLLKSLNFPSPKEVEVNGLNGVESYYMFTYDRLRELHEQSTQ